MAKRGNNNKNKVTNKIIGNRLSSKSKFQELNEDGNVKYTDKYLENTRRKMEPINMASDRRNELLAQEEKHVTNIMYVRGEQVKALQDLSYTYNNIFTTQQKQTEAVEQLYGIQNKLADKLQLVASSAQEIATAQRATRDMSLAELNTNQRTKSDLASINRLKMAALDSAQKLTLYNKQNIPYYDRINKMQAEIAVLTEKVGNNVGTENAYRLETLKTMVDQYKSLGKLEKRNTRTSEIQGSINDLMSMQGTAAGRILKTLKDIVTNPLLIFTGLLALGVSRFETMRQRGNQLAEELDRVNKKLAGAGPYQEAIIRRAKTIHSTFRAAGEGFSSSLEGAVDAVQSLEKQLGMIGSVSGNLVKLMSTIKLSINLSDEQAAKVIDTYLTVGDHSEKAAENSANMLYSLSEQAGLNPAETFKEIANATGESLAFIKGGTAELNNTVIAAKKLGLSLEDVATISRGLLDFESSIEAEMEARMLTGMNINFNKARMFAMNKEGAKAAKEVMRQVGGLERFQSMNIFQQEAVAKATGLSVDELLKTNVQRERQKQIAKDKQQIHEDTAKMLPIVTNVMGKLDTGMSAIEKIATILGDIVLNVFGVDFAQAEKLILSFVKSDTFQTGLKNVLFFMKGVIEGIIDAVSTVWDFLKKLPWLGDLVKNMGSMDMSGGFGGAQKGGKTVGKAVAYGYIAKKVLGLTPFTAMWVRSAAGAFAGLGSSIADGIKGLFGYGGQASAGAGGIAGGVTTAGWLAAGAFIAKGVYDVATLSGKNTRSEKAGAVGGAVGAIAGAKLGAMAGTAIFPGVGTAVGAAIGAAAGYFGGDMIKHFGIFQDDLDKSRIKLADSEMRLGLEATNQNNKLQMDVVLAQNKVRNSFVQFGLTTDGASKNEIKSFADAMVQAGNITKDEHKSAISGTMSAVELLERAAAGTTGNLTREQEARKVWVENQMQTQDISRYNRLAYNKELYTTIESLTNDMIENQITEAGLDSRGKIDYVLNPFRTEHDRAVLAREMHRLYKGTIPMDKIKTAVDKASHGMDVYVTKTDAVESGLEDLRDQLLQDVELLIDDDQQLMNQKKLTLMSKSKNMKYDRETGGLIVTPKDDPNKSTMRRGGVIKKFDGGGVTGGGYRKAWLNAANSVGGGMYRDKRTGHKNATAQLKGGDYELGTKGAAGLIDRLKLDSRGVSSRHHGNGHGGGPHERQKGGDFWDNAKKQPILTNQDYGLISGMMSARSYAGDGILENKSWSSWFDKDMLKPIIYAQKMGRMGYKSINATSWAGTDEAREHVSGMSIRDTEFWDNASNVGVKSRFNKEGKHKSRAEVMAEVKSIGQGTGGRELLIGMLAAAAAAVAVPSMVTGGLSGATTAIGGAQGLAIGGSIMPSAWALISGIAQAGLNIGSIYSIGEFLADIYTGEVGEGGLLAYASKVLPKPVNYVPKAFQAYNDMQQEPPDVLSFIRHLLPWDKTMGAENVVKFGMKHWEQLDKRSYRIGNRMLDEASPLRDIKALGGVTPTKVNDMLLSADGQLIETQEDDNLIANAGKIIQTKGGGGTNKDADLINSLLRELIIVSSDTVVEVDGRVVSNNLQLA